MLFHHLMADPDAADVYLRPFVLGFDSRARLNGFLAALQYVVDRNDIYRTALVWKGLPEPMQVVWRKAALPVTEVTLEAHGRAAVGELLALAGSWMDLGRPPLLRVYAAAEPGTGRWLGLLQIHHTIRDHMALELVLEEVTAFMSGQSDRCRRLSRSVTSWRRQGSAYRERRTRGISLTCWGTLPSRRRRSGCSMSAATARRPLRPGCGLIRASPSVYKSAPGHWRYHQRRCSMWRGHEC